MEFPQNLEDGLVMTVNQVEVKTTAFEFTYTVDNQSTQDVYLINTLYYFQNNNLQVDHNMTYVRLDNNDTLHISKQMMPIPNHIKVESPEIPLAIKVAAGETFSESLRIRIPVTPHDPYLPQSSSSTPSTASSFIFSLGYVISDQSMSIQQVTIPSGEQYGYANFATLHKHQRIKVSELLMVEDVPTTAIYVTNESNE